MDRSIEGSARDYAFVSTHVKRSGDGIWRTDSVTSTTASEKCTPREP
ncbi:hypothetical protein [Streptomyces venezuelae]